MTSTNKTISEHTAWCASDLSRCTIQRAQTPLVLDTVAALYVLLRRSPWFSIEIKGIFPSDPESSATHGEAHLPLSTQIFAQRCKSCNPTTRGEELVLIRQRVIPSFLKRMPRAANKSIRVPITCLYTSPGKGFPGSP